MQKSRRTRFRVVFMGTPEFAVPSLKGLIQGPDEIAAVVSQPDRPRGRGRKLVPTPVKEVALDAGLRVMQPRRVREPEFLDEIRAISPDLILVAAFGQILPQELLDIPGIMPMNVHGSLLPAYRGAAPIQWALINGDEKTGITIMRIDAGMDTGPMLLKRELAIGEDETFGTLMPRMAKLGAEALMDALDLLEKGKLKEQPQPEEGVTYAPPIKKEQLHIDWSQPTRMIHGTIRAFDPRPGAWTMMNEERTRLFSPFFVRIPRPEGAVPGQVLEADKRGMLVAAGDGVLGIAELQRPGKKRLAVGQFLMGRKVVPGTVLE